MNNSNSSGNLQRSMLLRKYLYRVYRNLDALHVVTGPAQRERKREDEPQGTIVVVVDRLQQLHGTGFTFITCRNKTITLHSFSSFLAAPGRVKSCGGRRYQYFIQQPLNVCECVCVPVMEEFHEHAFLLGVFQGMTVACFKTFRAVMCFLFRCNSSCHIKYKLRWDF